MFFDRRRKAFIVQDEIAKGLPVPSYARPGDVCMDIAAALRTVVPAFSGADVRTGLRVVPPRGYYFRVVGKGSSARVGFFFTLEIIDREYTGEIILHPWNASAVDVVVERGKCIAQLELCRVTPYRWKLVDFGTLRKTKRGEGRMDSTKTGI